jgi:hypothetical protein
MGFHLIDKNNDGLVDTEELEMVIDWLEEALGISEDHPIPVEEWQDLAREHIDQGAWQRRGMRGQGGRRGMMGGGFGRGR